MPSALRTDPRHSLFERYGIHLPDDAVFIGNDKGAVAFTGYTGDDVEVHICGDGKWGSPHLLRTVWAYIWSGLDCIRCTAKVREDREASFQIAMRMGFKVEGFMRQADKGMGVWILGMLREECKYGIESEAAEAARPADVDRRAVAGEPGKHQHPVRLTALLGRG